ncbi:unnamed protein product, partial [Laminaria digitata]
HFLRKSSLLTGTRAVFKPVVDRIDSLELQVLAHHGAVENNVVKIDLPAIKAILNSLQLRLVATVVSEVLASPLPPLGMLKPQGRSADAAFSGRQGWTNEGAGGTGAAAGRTADTSASSAAAGRAWQGMEMGMSPTPTVTSSWASKRHADWETLERCLHNRMQLIHTTRRTPHGASRLVQAMSAWSVKTRRAPSRHYKDARVSCARRCLSASHRLRRAVRLLKQKLQQRPNTHLVLHLKRLKLELWRDESSSPFLRAEIRRITADVMVYDDASGSLDLQVTLLLGRALFRTSYSSEAKSRKNAPPAERLQRPPPTSRGGPMVRSNSCPEAAPECQGAADVASEWWRAGGGGGGQQTLTALEVIKPLMRQDLERRSDQGNLRGWSPREITVHVQAQLGSPIGEMTLIRHFEAEIFPLVLHLRRSLFADLSAFSSDAVSALTSGGAGPDSATVQREEQIKATFLTSKKTIPKSGRSAFSRTRLRRAWKAKGSTTPAAGVPAADSGVGARAGGTGDPSVGIGGSMLVGPSTTWDSASDVGDAAAEDAGERNNPSPYSEPAAKEATAAREDDTGLMEKPMAVKHLRLGEVNIFLTYMGDRYMELEDVDNVHLKLHPMVYTNKTWTPRKLLLRIRRDVILDILSQVSRNFNNLGNFLNTRVAPKSGVSTNPSSSASAATSSAAGMAAGGRRGSRSDAASGKKSGAKGSAIPTSLGKNFGRPFSSEFLSDTLNAVSRSVSPVVRPKSLRKWGAREPRGEEGCKEEEGSVASTPGKGARRSVGWGGSRHQVTSPGFSSPRADTIAPRQRDIFESDGYSQDEVGDSPITIGPAAAAAAAAAEAASAQYFADAELAGMVVSRSPGGGGSGAAARSRADEHDAKLLLFG